MKKLIQVSVLIVLLFPFVTHAVWWNPFTWFKPKPTPQTVIQEVIKEVPETKIVTQTVKDPTLQSKIDSLTREVNDLKIKPVVSPVVPVVFDACKNIDGVQTLAPQGMVADNGNCFVPTSNTQTSNQNVVNQNSDLSRQQQIAYLRQMFNIYKSNAMTYANYSMYVNMTDEQLNSVLTAPGLIGSASAEQELVYDIQKMNYYKLQLKLLGETVVTSNVSIPQPEEKIYKVSVSNNLVGGTVSAATNVKIGSFVISWPSDAQQGVRITEIDLKLNSENPESKIRNVHYNLTDYNNNYANPIIPNMYPSQSNRLSTDFNLTIGESKTIDVYADLDEGLDFSISLSIGSAYGTGSNTGMNSESSKADGPLFHVVE